MEQKNEAKFSCLNTEIEIMLIQSYREFSLEFFGLLLEYSRFYLYYFYMLKQDEFITDFLDASTISALETFLESEQTADTSADKIATAFGAKNDFSKTNTNDSEKLVTSFKNNLTLLVQKTWVEKSDIALKDKLLYQLNEFLNGTTWKDNYGLFLELINQAVFLMFGQKPDTPDFAQYTLRIDPEFGIFWWYISNLPPKTEWSEEKCRLAMMLGMYFLANY